MNVAALVGLDAAHCEAARLKGADPGGNDDAAGIEARAAARLDVEAAVCAGFHARDFLAQIKPGREGSDLFGEALDELARRADGHGGDGIDRVLREGTGDQAPGLRARL